MKKKSKGWYITKRFRIRVYQGEYTYLVRIHNDIWEMSYHADRANGVCVYSGTIKDIPKALTGLYLVPVDEVPHGIKTQVARIIEES